MNRRTFMGSLSLLCAGMSFAGGIKRSSVGIEESEYDRLVRALLKEWCDGMLKHQVNDPGNPKLHGVLQCPACDVIHGRCWDSVYPFMHMARATGRTDYLNAAINAVAWSENVSGPDGRWTNDLSPDSWPGTTIFGAIALAESIKYHGDLLPPELLEKWTARLAFAAEGYLYPTFTNFTSRNMNYGMTSLYAFHLIGRVLGEQKYMDRSRELAKDVRTYFTEPNKLIFGEGKPTMRRSEKGLLQVDLGYNVEESFNSLVLYALEENDTHLLEFLAESMRNHLEFMLPDGAWDNSWGTRQAKWSYWGSRTSDGCQPAFSMMADRDPAFGTAAFTNLELLKQCTADGLLHGGPHYVSHGVKPCIHHTFAHAKVLAFLQDHRHSVPRIDKRTPLPRSVADGIQTFPELDVSLAARGPWRGTVSAYDALYTNARKRHIQQATGGSLAVLHHDRVGILFAASMAEYMQVEPQNTQPQPGEEFALTPRVEVMKDGAVFNNLYDLHADVNSSDDGSTIRFDVRMGLYDRDYEKLSGDGADFKASYVFDEHKVTIQAEAVGDAVRQHAAALILPVASPSGEPVVQVNDRRIEIQKPNGTVVVNSSVPLTIKPNDRGRIFNMVPGIEVVPILAQLPKEAGVKATCSISIKQE